MSGHGNTGKHLGALPKTAQRMLIEQAIALYGCPYKAAEKTGYPLPDCLAVYRRMEAACSAKDRAYAR